MSVRAEIAKLRRDMYELKEALASALLCDDGLEFKHCPFPEFARALIDELRSRGEADDNQLADELDKLL